MHWIYLSPHLDDIALSCGGLLWEQVSAGERVSVWTICAGDPPPGRISPFAQSLHERWDTGPGAVAQRRQEDSLSCSIMGTAYHHFSVPDCIYRHSDAPDGYLYPSEDAILGEIHPAERKLIDSLSDMIVKMLPQNAVLVSPLALGGHVDHRLTRAAAKQVDHPLWYYADYPYVLDEPEWPDLLGIGTDHSHLFEISQAGLRVWVEAVGAHKSQISTFWPDLAAMQVAIESYSRKIGGVILWAETTSSTSILRFV